MIRVALVEDDFDIRSGLELLIAGTDGYECLGAYADCESAIAALVEEQPDVMLMDIELPGMNGIEGTRTLRSLYSDLDVIMLTIREDDQAIFDSLCAGACGYLIKTTRPNKILSAIEEAAGGGAPMSSAVARMVIDSFRRVQPTTLTAREVQILRLLCEGKSYKAIAGELFISQGTVHTHLKNIYRKLEVHSKTEAMAKAIKDRLV
jgi:DNA-binding NarL/FixJ family response regulator